MKRWLLGAGIAGLALGTASAADLPVAPEPIDYVRVCDAFGAGYYYIPGTDTCLRIHGRVRVDYRYFDTDFTTNWRNYNSTGFRARGYIYMDSRSNTEFGLLRTFNEIYVTSDSPGGNRLTLNHSFVQLGGFTFGKTQSFFDFVEYVTWAAIYYPAVSDLKTPVAAYTHAFGNGFSGSLSLESADERRLGIGNYGPGYGGTKYPDMVANLRVDKGWGSAQVMGALHQVWTGANPAGVTPDSDLGWTIGAGVTFDMSLPGETSANLSGSYSQGAVAYVTSSPGGGPFEAYDGVYDPATNEVDTSEAWGVSGGITHNWTPTLSTALQGGYFSYANDAAPSGDFGQWSAQGNIVWAPVAGLIIGTELEYQYYDASSSSALGDGDNLAAIFRVQKTY
ncbi:porin [Amorphus orientalis]|uniref:Porin n=1 Tax=Amorphus orientalis TaxID=649198 RepID=A0AAE3VME5_9HYPH|nr:porin [Amorphus orientalis]MDQ0314794.1 hypothetical protein [Amorphus orientalis]